LGRNSTISFALRNEALRYFAHYSSVNSSVSQVQDEYDRVRNTPSRCDFRGRMHAKLPKPTMSFHEFCRLGIVLPFGALNAHFNVPNLSLFSFEGNRLQMDYAEALDYGCPFGEVIPEFYGCPFG
jgi:hypothetical protein